MITDLLCTLMANFKGIVHYCQALVMFITISKQFGVSMETCRCIRMHIDNTLLKSLRTIATKVHHRNNTSAIIIRKQITITLLTLIN